MHNTSYSHPTLVLVRGVPGSGKSYLARALEESLGQNHVVILDPDETDYESEAYKELSATLAADGVDAKFHPYRFLRAKAYKGIVDNKIVIWNQAFTNLDGFNKTIVNLQTYATEHGTHLPLLVVEVEVKEHVAKQRVAKRASEGGHDVTNEAFTRFLNDYRSFTEEGFNTVIVNGEDDIKDSVAAIRAALDTLWKQ